MKKIYLALAIALVAAGVFRLKAEATGMGESRGFRLEAEGMGDPGTGDWPMWGGTADRNMVSNMKGLPLDWDVKTKKNVKWVADLGSQTYGNVVVAGGMVFVGTNNEGLRDPKQPGDRGVLMAFKEDTGEFLWQQTHEKLSSGRSNDWPYQGVASSPARIPPTAARSSSRAARSTSTRRRTPHDSASRSSTRISPCATTSTSSRTCTSAARRSGSRSSTRRRWSIGRLRRSSRSR